MIYYGVIAFFFVFLLSRFFTEVLTILPKWLDVIDLPFIAAFFLLSLTRIPSPKINHREYRFIAIAVFLAVFVSLLSVWFNSQETILPAAVLFMAGILEGPLLYLALTRSIYHPGFMAERVEKLFIALMLINLAIVLFHNIPLFFATANPDVISGSYGNNAYLFSVFIMIAGGLALGKYGRTSRHLIILIPIQLLIIAIYYMLQYRAAVPFFIFAYALMLWGLFGHRAFKYSFLIGIVIFGALVTTSNIITASDRRTFRYEDWKVVASSPTQYLKYGKFQAYDRTIDMFTDQPESILLGVGPGNYVSRANYTFSYELQRSRGKGVGKIISDLFGIERPHFTRVSTKYIANLRGEAVLGSFQFSNPNSSYLASIAELGLIGGGCIILLYFYLVIKSFHLLRLARDEVPHFVPLATALLGSTTYLMGLAFLDNYWEIARATLPIWLLFWVTSAGIHAYLSDEEYMEQEDVEYAS